MKENKKRSEQVKEMRRKKNTRGEPKLGSRRDDRGD